MWDQNGVNPKIKTAHCFKPLMSDIYVEAFNNGTFNQNGNESGLLKMKYYKPANLIFQHLPVTEKEKNIEVNRMGNGYIIDTLTAVDSSEIVKMAGKVIHIYEGVVYLQSFKKSPFRKVTEKLFALRQKYKDKKK